MNLKVDKYLREKAEENNDLTLPSETEIEKVIEKISGKEIKIN